MTNSQLNSSFNIKSLSLENRISMAPLYLGYGNPDGTVSELLLDHYSEMAESGVSMIVVENASVTPAGVGSPFTIRIDEDQFVPGLSKLADVIKDKGVKAIQQINHCGKFAFSPEPLGPSAGPEGKSPRAITKEEIKDTVQYFADAAARVKQAGFEGVEIHGGTGYLIDQFLSPFSNQRTDEYGGSLENRMRFSLEIFEAVKAAVGEDFPVGHRFLADEALPGGFTLDEGKVWAKELENRGVAYLSVMYGTYDSFFLPEYAENERTEGYMSFYAGEIKKTVPNTPIIAAGRIQTPQLAEKMIEEGKADIVGLARVLLADPLWPKKAVGDIIDPINPCRNTCTLCMKRVMQGKPVFCARWEKERRFAFLARVGEKPEEVDQSDQ
jgi:2,4-dienoyl-CoA reductase-like NADH-dependent reductase (Old Yellow Enzyme family)